MNEFLELLQDNYHWVFSGIGTVFLGLVIRAIVRRRKASPRTTITTRDQHGDITVFRDVNITHSENIESIENYLAELKKANGRSHGRIGDLPLQLNTLVREALENGPMTVEKLASEVGVTDKMMENILTVMADKGFIRQEGDVYHLDQDKNSG